MSVPRHAWTQADKALLRRLYPHKPTLAIAQRLQLPVGRVYAKAANMRLRKSAAFLASPAAHRLDGIIGRATRFQKGHVPANKGLRRPGWAPGRMAETQFKKGQLPANSDPDFHVLGALRVNTDGYIDMRVSFDIGAMGWKALHRILWEDEHGPVPKGYLLTFRDRDKLNVCLENLELISLADNCRRNSIHNLPAPLARAIQLRGALIRQINRKEKQHAQHA